MVIHSKPNHLHGCVVFPSNISCLGVGTEVGGGFLAGVLPGKMFACEVGRYGETCRGGGVLG